jgi:DNA replicative helicase MCM subunit Mcm2 (Cdc46/Mcm family)
MGADHQSLLEAMEQQSISIAKAGMSLNACLREAVVLVCFSTVCPVRKPE